MFLVCGSLANPSSLYANERADCHTKKGIMRCTVENENAFLFTSILFIKQNLQSTHNLLPKIETKYGRNNLLLHMPEKPRRETVAVFRLLTKHD